MRELALFAGAGGGILGGLILGWRTVCAVEIDPYCRSVLLARQRDGHIGEFPIWDDVSTFDGESWRGHVDVISGGFPCQDISAAGRGAGLAGARSGLWREFARIIGEVRPAHVFIENSPLLRTRGLVTVLQDLAGLGFDARWGVLGADDAGACQTRKRMWIVAHAEGNRCGSRRARGSSTGGAREPELPLQDVADSEIREGRTDDPTVPGESVGICACEAGERRARGLGGGDRPGRPTIGWWDAEPDVGRVAHGVAVEVERYKAIANGQVPAVAALAWETLK